MAQLIKPKESIFIEEFPESAQTDSFEQPLVYYGNQLNMNDEVLSTILDRRHLFFQQLNPDLRDKFLDRLKKFLAGKCFIIHDSSGFREMPVLISATAIQLSFGWEAYMLPAFHNIHIYPREFYRTEPNIVFLEGNVSNGCINISWKHFLQGFEINNDGKNVGLHEMAHAYCYQFLEVPEKRGNEFKYCFSAFSSCSNEIISAEKNCTSPLYSVYELSNEQEFWAESIEVFFERPDDLRKKYPQLYACVSEALNIPSINKTAA